MSTVVNGCPVLDIGSGPVWRPEERALPVVVPLFCAGGAWRNRERWRVREEDSFWFCGDGFGEWGGIGAGDSSCRCSAAVYGFCGFAGWGGKDDAVVAGGSADWQIIRPDGAAVGDVRYTLRTDDGALLYVQSRGVRHGPPEVLERLARGEDVEASEYTFRTSTQIETAAPGLDWLNKGVFVSVGGRQAAGVIYETYLVE